MPKTSDLQKRINQVTGAERTARLYKGKSGRDVNMDRVKRGKRAGFGTTTQKREDLVAAFGGD